MKSLDRVRNVNPAPLFQDQCFISDISNSLFVEFQSGSRQVFRAGWITEVRIVGRIVTATFNPAINIKDGRIKESGMGLINLSLDDEMVLFDLKGEYHFALNDINHFSFYPIDTLVNFKDEARSIEGVHAYVNLLRSGQLITSHSARTTTEYGLPKYAGAEAGMMRA